MPKRLPLSIGDQFGDWTVISEPRKRIWNCGSCDWVVSARCRCGVELEIRESVLKNRKTTKCRKCSNRLKNNFKHGMSDAPEYRIWRQMIARCYDVFHVSYHDYGGRGVIVCDRWNPSKGGSFQNFYADMGPRPSPDHQLDKEAVFLSNKIYGPGLVKWVPRAENLRRKRNAVLVECNGEMCSLSALADKYNLPYNLALRRIHSGMTFEEALKDLKSRGTINA